MSEVRSAQRAKDKSFLKSHKIDRPILLIEDQSSSCRLLAQKLEDEWQADVHVAINYEQAKSLLKKHRHEYLIAIGELSLPDAGKGEILDLVSRAEVPIVALIDESDLENSARLLREGVIDHVVKDSVTAFDYLSEVVGRLYKNLNIGVLVVEDSASIRVLLCHMLKAQNFIVYAAENGHEALELLDHHDNIKVMITDYNMPDMNGFELTLTVRKSYAKSELSIIGISGSNDDELGVQFIKNGANDFIVKPVSYGRLLSRVNQNVELIEYIETIHNIANRDYLTSLFNRRYFFETGEELYQESKDNNLPLTSAMVDIDHFKSINDNFGHDAGDEVLKLFSGLLDSEFREHLVARIGGEEFVVVISNSNDTEARLLLDTFREKVENLCCDWLGQSIKFTASIGYTNKFEDNLDLMLKAADRNLYIAKEQGRNRVVG